MNQFTQPHTLRGAGVPAGEDPLAELARIVGRNQRSDPFDTLLEDARAAGQHEHDGYEADGHDEQEYAEEPGAYEEPETWTEEAEFPCRSRRPRRA